MADQEQNPNGENPAISLDQVSFSYPGANESVFEDISLNIHQNAITVVLGHNGVGKTTLFYLMLGILKASQGNVIVAGRKLRQDKDSRAFIRDHVGFVFQDPNDQLFTPSVWDDIAFGPKNKGNNDEEIESIVKSVANKIGITHLLDKKPHEISTGEQKLVAIAAAISNSPDIVIMDEPLANLDARSKRKVTAAINDLHAMGKTILFSAHDTLAAAELATATILLESKNVMRQGSCDIILRDMPLLKNLGIDTNPITELFWGLQRAGVIRADEPLPITIAEAGAMFRKYTKT